MRFDIKFQVNKLFSVSEEDGSLIDAIGNSEELPIFTSRLVQDLIDYKWDTFAKRIHVMGAFIHLLYLFTIMYYISETFLIKEQASANTDLLTIICVCLVYPLVYEAS